MRVASPTNRLGKPARAAERAGRTLEVGGERPQGAMLEGGSEGKGRPPAEGRKSRCGAVAVAVAVAAAVAVAVAGAGYILHLRESNPRSGEKRRQRRSAGGSR